MSKWGDLRRGEGELSATWNSCPAGRELNVQVIAGTVPVHRRREGRRDTLVMGYVLSRRQERQPVWATLTDACINHAANFMPACSRCAWQPCEVQRLSLTLRPGVQGSDRSSSISYSCRKARSAWLPAKSPFCLMPHSDCGHDGRDGGTAGQGKVPKEGGDWTCRMSAGRTRQLLRVRGRREKGSQAGGLGKPELGAAAVSGTPKDLGQFKGVTYMCDWRTKRRKRYGRGKYIHLIHVYTAYICTCYVICTYNIYNICLYSYMYTESLYV